MTTFDAREKEFEARFKYDQELQFKITARRNRLLGLWAAQHLGLLGDSAEAYAERVVQAQLQPGGNKNVVDNGRRPWRQGSDIHRGSHPLRARPFRRTGEAATHDRIASNRPVALDGHTVAGTC